MPPEPMPSELFPLPGLSDILPLCEAEGPCLSFFLPRHRAGARTAPMAVTLQTLLRSAEDTMQQEGIPEDDRGQLLEPVYQLSAEPEMQQSFPYGAAIYRSPGLLASFSLKHDNGQSVELMERFQLAPLVEQARYRAPFRLLLVSRSGVRLYEASRQGLAETETGPDFPASFDEFHQLEDRDRQDLNRFHGPASAGGGRVGSTFGAGTEDERDPQRLQDYYAAVDAAIRRLPGPELPLVLSGAVAECAHYRIASEHPRLVEAAVSMSLEGGAALGDIEQSARQLMHSWRGEQELRAMERFHQEGPAMRSTNLEEILQAAVAGRVDHLFFQARERIRGNVRRLLGPGGARQSPMLPGSYVCFQEDLVNAAVVETLKRRGSVWPLPPELVPSGAAAAALMRYSV